MNEISTPVITRVAAILRAVGRERGGVTTTAVARATDIPRATAHRMLTALAEQGLIDREADNGLWFLGLEIYLLGSVSTSRYDAAPVADDLLRALADDTGESAFPVRQARLGDGVFPRSRGGFPLRSYALPGQSIPARYRLGRPRRAGPSPRTVRSQEYLRRAALQKDRGPRSIRAAIEERLGRTRIDGYSLNPGLLVEGSWGIGAAVFDALGRPQWALSLTGVQAGWPAIAPRSSARPCCAPRTN